MDTTDPHSLPPATESHSAAPSARTLIEVEISTLDQHGDPGFVHTRGHFHSHSTAARFAVSQAETVADLRQVDTVAATFTQTVDDSLCLIGTPGEIACALASMSAYAPGVRSAELPPPGYVTAAIGVWTVTPIEPLPGVDPGDLIDVSVRSTRPDPLPDSTTVAGDFPAHSAHIFAGALAREITMRSGGHSEATVKTVPGQRRLVVEHPVEVDDADVAAVARYTRITQLRANIAVLDPVADAECAVGLTAELHVLESHTRRSFDDKSGAVA